VPVKECQSDGVAGWKCGDAGKCYTGPDAKKRAINQCIAIGEEPSADGVVTAAADPAPAGATVTAILDGAAEAVLGHEERLAKAASSVLRTAGRVAARNFKDAVASQVASLTAAGEPPDWTPPHPDELVDVDAVVAGLRTKSDPIRLSAIEEYGSALKSLYPDLKWNVANPLVGAVLAGTGEHVQGIAETTRINLMRIIRASHEEGLSIDDTAKAIREGMDAASTVRGRLIARPELAAVTNGGSLAATKIVADASGQPFYKRWMTAPGAHYPRHEDYPELDGQTVGLDEPFDVGGYALQFPGDPDGPPEEICNCRCSLAYVESPDEALLGGPPGPPEMPDASEADAALAPLPSTENPDELAGVLFANASEMEPYVTQAMRAAVEPLGGQLQGLEFRLKSEASIARKLSTDVASRAGISNSLAATALKDTLRYTAVYRPGEFVDKATKTLDALKQAGIQVERIRSTWAPGEEYVGTNAVMKAPNGFRFELQFHTPESLRAKETLNHPLYERWRRLDPETPEAREVWREMVANADAVRRPPGVQDWAYDGHVTADVGITPFREGVDDPVGFYDSEKFQRFRDDAGALADRFGVSLDVQDVATGVWEGSEEPSVRLVVHDGQAGVRGFSAALARAYRQDGVAIFQPGLGNDVIARFARAEAAPLPAELRPFDVPAEGLPVYRTEQAHSAYKGKSSWGEGRYFAPTREKAADYLVDPHAEVVQEPDLSLVDEHVLPAGTRLAELDADEVNTARAGLEGEELRRKVLAAGYDGVVVKTESMNLGGDQIVLYREPRIPEAAGATLDEVLNSMGARDLMVDPEHRPDLFRPSIKLKGGGFATPRNDLPAPRVKTRADKSTYGKPPRIEDTVENKFGNAEVVEGSERPPEYLYRAISEEDYQASVERGFIQSDQRMNLADEGTVADFTDPSFYLPGKLASDADGVYPGRIVRIRYRDQDGWILDRDGYAKTHEPIPMGQVDLVSPVIETEKSGTPAGGVSIETRVVPSPKGGPLDRDRAYEAMARAGLPAGRFLEDGSLEIIGSGPDFVKKLDAVARDLGARYDAELGQFDLLEAASGDYERAITDAERATPVGARADRAAPTPAERAGRAPVGEGAGGPAEVPGALEAQGRVLLPGELGRLPWSPEDFMAQPPVEPRGDRAALGTIFGPDGIATQDALRAGDVPAWMQADLKVIDDTVASTATPSAGKSFRGVMDLSRMFGVGADADVKVGDVIFDPGYAPTTLDERVAEKFARGDYGGNPTNSGFVTYHLPKGAPGLYENLVTKPTDAWADLAAGEYQLLLPRGQNLRVIGVDELRGLTNVHVELVDHPVTRDVPAARPAAPRAAPKLKAPPDVSPPASPPQFQPPYPPSEAARFGPDRLWGAHAEVGRLENAARAELPELRDDQLVDLLWKKGEGRVPKGKLSFADVAGDQQAHTVFSDGHQSVAQMAEEARRRGETHIVISDHAHALTSEDIAAQREQIDSLNAQYRASGSNFKILQGIEANILADGSLDVAPEVLAQFDVVNAAIHGPIEAPGGQLALFREANTARLLRAMDNPELNVLVHPHSVPADWDAIAKKAAQKGIALEVNGRDMLRNGRQEAAADMIAAARRHGAKLVFGSDAHTSQDLVDMVYAVRFARTHGVTREDLAPIARAQRLGEDRSASLPASIDTSASPDASQLGGGMNEVWKVETREGTHLVVKPEPDPDVLAAAGFEDEPLRRNVSTGMDLERERAGYLMSNLFNDVGTGHGGIHVNVPAYRIGEFERPVGTFEARVDRLLGAEPLPDEYLTERETSKAGIGEFVPGTEGRNGGSPLGAGMPPEEVRAAGLFDAVIGNTDRHAGNYLYGDDGKLWLIDHGLSFPVGPGISEADDVYGYPASVQFQNQRLVEAAIREAHGRGEVGNFISDEERAFLEDLRSRMPDAKDELVKLIGRDGYDEILMRLDALIEERDFDRAVFNIPPGTEVPQGVADALDVVP